MTKDFFDISLEKFDITNEELKLLSPLVLAYIGDSVYEVLVRTYTIKKYGNLSPNKLHRLSIGLVKAHSQSDIIHALMYSLTDDEADIVRRGRNAKSGTIPKNANVTEYKYATGFESLIGYLYLRNDTERMMQIFDMAVEANQKESGK